jgi:hypothetical protein
MAVTEKVKNRIEMDAGLMRACMWSGVAVIVALIIAQGFLMHFIPGLSPDMPAEELQQHFIDRKMQIRVGAVIQCFFWMFWATWSMAITLFIRKMERGYPILTYCSIALNGGGYVFFILIPMTWAVIAFRPETLDPEIMQIMNDWVWFDWLFTWPPFALFMAIIGIAILKNQTGNPLYPRWVAYLNFWCAVLIFPAALIAFFKTGLFAYDGIGAFWLPVVVFFGWIAAMTIMTFRAISLEEARLQAGGVDDPSTSDL